MGLNVLKEIIEKLKTRLVLILVLVAMAIVILIVWLVFLSKVSPGIYLKGSTNVKVGTSYNYTIKVATAQSYKNASITISVPRAYFIETKEGNLGSHGFWSINFNVTYYSKYSPSTPDDNNIHVFVITAGSSSKPPYPKLITNKLFNINIQDTKHNFYLPRQNIAPKNINGAES